MKSITKEAIRSFLKAKPFSKSNTSVRVLPNVTVLSLFGNEIAYLHNDPERTLSITNAGWVSKTTKERLNALPNVNIRQKNYEIYLNGEKWDGRLKDVVKLAEYKNIYLEKMKENGEARENIKRYLEIKNMSTEKFLEEVVLV
jgi:hypothetical protein